MPTQAARSLPGYAQYTAREKYGRLVGEPSEKKKGGILPQLIDTFLPRVQLCVCTFLVGMMTRCVKDGIFYTRRLAAVLQEMPQRMLE